jgi:hypothetical protein
MYSIARKADRASMVVSAMIYLDNAATTLHKPQPLSRGGFRHAEHETAPGRPFRLYVRRPDHI